MLKQFFYPMVGLLLSMSLYANVSAMEKGKLVPPSVEEFHEKVFLVHLFPSSLPNDLILRPTSALPLQVELPAQKDLGIPIVTLGYKFQLESTRASLYFSLNCVAPSNPKLDMSVRHFAAVLPFSRALAQRTLNLSPTDTSILGEIDLSKEGGSVLFVPHDFSEKPQLGLCELKSYEGNLTDAILAYLKTKTPWEIVCKEAEDGLEEAYFDQAFIGPQNVNTPAFFQSILDAHPIMSFGQDTAPMVAGISVQLCYLNRYTDEFQRLYKIGCFKDVTDHSHLILKNYRVDPFCVLMEKALAVVRMRLENQDPNLSPYFLEKSKGIDYAIVNLRNYIAHLQGDEQRKNRYDARPHSFTQVHLWLQETAFEFVDGVLKDPVFEATRDIHALAYWTSRIFNAAQVDTKKDDQNCKLALEASCNHLKKKYSSPEKIDYEFLWFMNTLACAVKSGVKTPKAKKEYTKVMNILKPLIGPYGIIKTKVFGGFEGSQDYASFFAQFHIIQDNFWTQSTKLPLVVATNRTLNTLFG